MQEKDRVKGRCTDRDSERMREKEIATCRDREEGVSLLSFAAGDRDREGVLAIRGERPGEGLRRRQSRRENET